MKLKVLPEDFRVDELATIQPTARGAFALFRLTKRGIGTPEAIRELCQRLRLAPKQISYGGLKDRHAISTQHLTIAGGPAARIQGRRWTLEPLGRLEEPFGPQHFRGNHFRIVLRDLSKPAVSRARVRLDQVARDGVANYFDEQRFRSVSHDRRFIARALIDGDFEEAVRLAVAEPYEHDRATDKAEKAQLQRSWRNWKLLAATLRLGPTRRVVLHLAEQPEDWIGAFARLPHELQSLYLSAYQSHLWNRILARALEVKLPRGERCEIGIGGEPLPMPCKPASERLAALTTLQLPLPSARLRFATNDPLRALYEEVLERENLTLAQMKIDRMRKPFFSKGARAALFIPEQPSMTKARDDRYSGKWKICLEFALPRGCYATMLIKRLTTSLN